MRTRILWMLLFLGWFLWGIYTFWRTPPIDWGLLLFCSFFSATLLTLILEIAWFQRFPAHWSSQGNANDSLDSEESPKINPKEILQVLFDEEHIADLELTGYDQPFCMFHLTILTHDVEKLRSAFDMSPRKRGQTILMSESQEWYYTENQFGCSLHEGDNSVSVRFFGAPHRVSSKPPDE